MTDLVAGGKARFIAFPHPFETLVRIDGEVPAGWTVAEALKEARFVEQVPTYAGIRVVRNGVVVRPGDYETTILASGDRLIARALAKDPVSITAFFVAVGTAIAETAAAVGAAFAATSVGSGFISGVGAALTGGGIGGITAGGIAYGIGFAIGYAGVYAAGAFLLSLATRALIGSPDSSGTGSSGSRRVSPTASGAGNQLLLDHPPYICCGDVRVYPPHIAMPFQPGYVGGRDQDPAQRMLLGVAGNCLVSDIKLGKTDISLLDIKATVFQGTQSPMSQIGATTVNFPTVAIKRPGITLRDEYGGTGWEIFATDDECDELSMVWVLQGGLQRINQKGLQHDHQLSFDIEYRVAGAGGWDGWFWRDGAGNSGFRKVPSFVYSYQQGGTNRLHLHAKTTEPFFFYLHRKVLRERYEIRVRLRSHTMRFKFNGSGQDAKGEPIKAAHWPRDRGVTGDTDTLSLSTDPTIVQLAAFRNEPAIENFAPGLSGIDLELIDQTTKSDDSSRISFRCRRQIPDLSGGARTAPTTTSNPASIVLDLLTGPMAGDSAEPDSKIDFPSFQAFWDHCAEMVPTIDGGTEVRHRMDAVLDRSGIGRREQVADILKSYAARLIRLDGKYHISVDKKRTASLDLLGEGELLEFESDRSWTVIPDALRVEFWNGEKNGDKDERVVYNDSPAVAGILEHGGYAERTAEKGTAGTPVSVTITRPVTNYAAITRASGTWTFDGFPEEGWVCVRWTGTSAPNFGFATAGPAARLFLIDSISSDLLTLNVIDKAADITTGTRNGRFNTTAAERIESLSLPYTQRPSECFRTARYYLAQRNRPEIYSAHVGPLRWMGLYQGAMFDASTSVCKFGSGSGRVLAIAGTGTSCTGVQMDEEFDLAGISVPVIKFVTHVGSSNVTTRFDVDGTRTTELRAGGDNRWLGFAPAVNVTAIGLAIGGGNGSVGAFGEKFYETKELIVQEIRMGADLSATLRCIDHAPEIFPAIVDMAPVPRYQSGIVETGTGDGARPAMPQLSAGIDGPSTPMTSITAAAPSGGFQSFTRADGSWLDEGYTDTHKVSFEGYATATNNKVRADVNGTPSATVLSAAAASGSSESGTGDERARGVIGTAVTTLHIDRAATGIVTLDVAPQGGGVVWLNGTGAFASFRGAGWIELLDVAEGVNNGWWPVTSKPSNDRLVLSDPTNSMLASTGTGSERCHQSQVYRSGGSFVTDGLAVGDRVGLDGFGQEIAAMAFTLRGVSANALYLDDPFGQLVTEVGTADETVTKLRVPVAYEALASPSGALMMEVTVPIRPGAKSVVTVEEIECRYRLRDMETGRVTGGWTPAGVHPAGVVSVTFGPVPADSDWDFACRSISREKTASDWCVLTGGGRKDRPAKPEHLQVHSDAVAGAAGQRFALRVEWAAVAAVQSYLLRWKLRNVAGWESEMIQDATSAVIYDATIATYDLELYAVDTSGQPSAVLVGEYDFEPDRDFEDAVVQNFRVLNHASPAA